MISPETFITDTLNTVDMVVGTLVQSAYANFVQANAGVITLLFTVYVMYLGYQFLNHHHHFNLSVVMRHMIVMLCVYGLVMNWQLYQLFVYNIFTNEPGNIAQILINSTGKFQEASSVTEAMNGMYKVVLDTSWGLFGQAGLSPSSLVFIVYGAFVYLIGTLMCIYALLLFIYAKMTMAIVLALGPVFILFILWSSTRGLFNAWLNTLISLALIPVMTSAILMLMLAVVQVTLPMVEQPAENLQFYGIAPFLGLCLATTLILSQVLRICSSLGGGIALAGLSAGGDIAKQALEKSGVAAAGRFLGKWAGNKARQIRRSIF